MLAIAHNKLELTAENSSKCAEGHLRRLILIVMPSQLSGDSYLGAYLALSRGLSLAGDRQTLFATLLAARRIRKPVFA